MLTLAALEREQLRLRIVLRLEEMSCDDGDPQIG